MLAELTTPSGREETSEAEAMSCMQVVTVMKSSVPASESYGSVAKPCKATASVPTVFPLSTP